MPRCSMLHQENEPVCRLDRVDYCHRRASYVLTHAHNIGRSASDLPSPHRVASALVYQVTRSKPYLGSSKLSSD